jgi:Bacterial pre-peptidase C-terminal domain/PKD domain/Metallo-peptidase family M12B Reprolysin-like
VNRTPLIAAALAALFVAGGALAQGRSAQMKPPFPQLALPEARAHGQRAIDLLGDRLPEVAAWYRKSPDELRALLLNDRMLKIDRRGRLFVEEEFIAPQPATPAETSTGLLDGTLAPLDQTFLLHSKPGAKRTIYLNFQGATLNNTAWGTGLVALPFDMDGVPYSFSTAELQRVQGIWQRVAEDFAPFDVNVTTQVPSADLINRSGAADDVFGTTVLITSRSGVYSCSCGGVAYIGIFDDTSDYYKPALVFWDALGSGEKNVAEAISHEAGHNMGLNHDGTPSAGYYTGHGSGTTGWAPIMGVGYYQNLVQWSKGEYSGANNAQDDYTVMQSNGLPLRADDHGNTTGTASPMGGSSSGGISSLAASGVIERPTDVDMFSFSAGAGSATVTLSPAARSANLDALIELRNSAGALLASANPADALNASLTFSLPAAGTYYVSVQGVAKGDPLTTGYTDYGSLGQYALAVSAPTGSGSAPTAVVSANPTSGTAPLTVSFSSTGSSDIDGTIVGTAWTFGDGGSASASGATASHGAWHLHRHAAGDRQHRPDRPAQCDDHRAAAGGGADDARGRYRDEQEGAEERQRPRHCPGQRARPQRQPDRGRHGHGHLERHRGRQRQRAVGQRRQCQPHLAADANGRRNLRLHRHRRHALGLQLQRAAQHRDQRLDPALR